MMFCMLKHGIQILAQTHLILNPPDHEQDDVTVSFSDEIIINIFLYGTRICSDKVPTLPRNFKK